jgi:hypothetical protein
MYNLFVHLIQSKHVVGQALSFGGIETRGVPTSYLSMRLLTPNPQPPQHILAIADDMKLSATQQDSEEAK